MICESKTYESTIKGVKVVATLVKELGHGLDDPENIIEIMLDLKLYTDDLKTVTGIVNGVVDKINKPTLELRINHHHAKNKDKTTQIYTVFLTYERKASTDEIKEILFCIRKNNAFTFLAEILYAINTISKCNYVIVKNENPIIEVNESLPEDPEGRYLFYLKNEVAIFNRTYGESYAIEKS